MARGILRWEPHTTLFLFRDDRYPLADAAPERELRGRVRAALQGDAAPDGRTLALVSLLDATDLLDALVTKVARKTLKRRVTAITKAASGVASVVASAAARAAAAAAAVMVAVIAAPAGAGAAASSS